MTARQPWDWRTSLRTHSLQIYSQNSEAQSLSWSGKVFLKAVVWSCFSKDKKREEGGEREGSERREGKEEEKGRKEALLWKNVKSLRLSGAGNETHHGRK